MTDLAVDQPPRAHARVVYLGPVSPHWEVYGDWGDRTVLDEFYRVAFRKKLYRSIEDLQADLDVWVAEYNTSRPHQGRWCYRKTPMQTFLDATPLAREKIMRH